MSIMEEAIKAGFATALIQSGCITEAGTAVFIASVRDRWGDRPLIAQQIIESGLDVILSGGERFLLPQGVQGRHGVGERADGINLIKRAKELGYTVVYTRDELMAAAADPAVTRVLGVFAWGHTFNDKEEEVLRAERLPLYWPWAPTMYEMAEATLRILGRNPRAERGIFIVAEDEGTDNFGNRSNARGSFEAGRRSDNAMGVFLRFLANNPNTLLLNAADSGAGAKSLRGLDPAGMERIRATKVAEGYFASWHNTDPGGRRIFVPVDGIDGAGTVPFRAAPDKFGNRWEFVVQWLRDDVAGHTVARAKGLNAGVVRRLGIVDSTDIYRIMYYTMFGKWLGEPIR
jgi:alkaline phosphatase